ncbi:unnamed protein product [Arabidopsis halleri]
MRPNLPDSIRTTIRTTIRTRAGTRDGTWTNPERPTGHDRRPRYLKSFRELSQGQGELHATLESSAMPSRKSSSERTTHGHTAPLDPTIRTIMSLSGPSSPSLGEDIKVTSWTWYSFSLLGFIPRGLPRGF